MKRKSLIFISLSLILLLSLSFVSAGFFSDSFNKLKGTLTGKVVSTNDLTPRIAYWWGKVNQHTEEGIWKTDPDGRSGANIDMLTYCKKWYPDTIKINEYKSETIEFKSAGNKGSYISTRTSYECVQSEESDKNSCVNECLTSGQKICDGNYLKTCGNYDSDSCLEYSSLTYCSYGCSEGVCLTENISSGLNRWTQWFDRDDPSGSGDYETLKDIKVQYPNKVCDSPTAVECQTISGLDLNQTGEIVVCDKDKGAYCINSQQSDGRCNYDYKVRFYCGEEQNNSENLSNSCNSLNLDYLNFGTSSPSDWEKVFSCEDTNEGSVFNYFCPIYFRVGDKLGGDLNFKVISSQEISLLSSDYVPLETVKLGEEFSFGGVNFILMNISISSEENFIFIKIISSSSYCRDFGLNQQEVPRIDFESLYNKSFTSGKIINTFFNLENLSCPKDCMLVNNRLVPVIYSTTKNPFEDKERYFSTFLDNQVAIQSFEIEFFKEDGSSWCNTFSMDSLIKAKSKELAVSSGDFENAKNILDWVKNSKFYCSYDLEENNTCFSLANNQIEGCYSTEDLFNSDYGVCLDSVVLGVLMLRAAGIPAATHMIGISHIVVLFYANSNWYYVDTTFPPQGVFEPVEITQTDTLNSSLVYFESYYRNKTKLCAEDRFCYYLALEPNGNQVVYFNENYFKDFSEFFVPNPKLHYSSESGVSYNCYFDMLDFNCEGEGCKEGSHSFGEGNWFMSFSKDYDVGIDTSVFPNYLYLRVPSDKDYIYACYEKGFFTGKLVSFNYFHPRKNERIVLGFDDLKNPGVLSDERYNLFISVMKKQKQNFDIKKYLSNREVDYSYSPSEKSATIFPETDCSGCSVNKKCYALGYRKGSDFCSEEFGMVAQFSAGSYCENSYECLSNVCLDGECIKASTWQKFLNWFSKIFS